MFTVHLVQINCFSHVDLKVSVSVPLENTTQVAAPFICRAFFFFYLKEVYFFDAILPCFGIHQVEYLSRDERESRCYVRKAHLEGEGGCAALTGTSLHCFTQQNAPLSEPMSHEL